MNIFGTKGYSVLLSGDRFALMLPLGKWLTVLGCPSEISGSLKIHRCLGTNSKDFEPVLYF